MAKGVKWSMRVDVDDGPTLSSSGKIESDAIETVKITLVAEDTPEEKIVLVQPGDLSMIDFVYIKSDQYGDLDNPLSYKFSEGNKQTDNSETVRLDKDHFLTSNELLKLFKKSPKQIKFTNGTGKDATIDIVLARKAIGA